MYNPNRPIPQAVYNQVLYAPGSTVDHPPVAVMREFTLSLELDYPTFRPYVIARKNGKRIPLAQVPTSNVEDWRVI